MLVEREAELRHPLEFYSHTNERVMTLMNIHDAGMSSKQETAAGKYLLVFHFRRFIFRIRINITGRIIQI